jgi:4-hydroxy-4-methyl-2-oxoglutarate aldolase
MSSPSPSSVSSKLGFRIAAAPPRLPDALVERFRGIAAANVADAMGRFNFMDPGILSRTGLSLCGRAVTVRCRPADNLMVHKALQVADPGDVIVVATCGNTTSAVFGELMCHTAAAKKIGGIIVDGAIRDVDGIRRLGMPAFSRSVSPGACDKDGPGEINLPIACGDTVVMPGDIVIGDKDGVAVVPRDDAEAVLSLVGELMARETARIAEIGRGVLYRAEIDESLRKKGVIE